MEGKENLRPLLHDNRHGRPCLIEAEVGEVVKLTGTLNDLVVMVFRLSTTTCRVKLIRLVLRLLVDEEFLHLGCDLLEPFRGKHNQ